MKEYLFLAGQIRALEQKLLSPPQVDRMVGASDVSKAFRVFTELQYAEYLDKEVTVEEFSLIIDKGLQETKQLIKKGTENALEFQFIWKEFDLNNIKRALKQSLVEGKKDLENFSEENGFSLLGDISAKDLQAIIFDKKEEESFPIEYKTVTQKAKNIYKETKNFQAVEFALDRAHFDFLAKVSKQCKSLFLQKYLSLKADLSNSKSFIRLVSANQSITEDCFVSHGKIPVSELISFSNKEELVKGLNKYEYFSLTESLKKCIETYSDEDEFILHFERTVSAYYENFLLESESGEISSIQIPMVYFMRRVKNARVLRFILFSKMYGLSPEKIYQTLKHL